MIKEKAQQDIVEVEFVKTLKGENFIKSSLKGVLKMNLIWSNREIELVNIGPRKP